METFTYRALDGSGRPLSGQITARDEAQAARELLRQGLRLTELAPVAVAVPAAPTALRRRTSIGSADQVVVLSELSTLVKAGVPLDEALMSMSQGHAASAMGPTLQRALLAVRAGQSVHDALVASGLALPEHLLTLVKVGEASGQLAASLAAAATQLESSRRALQELRNALIYPAVLVGAGLLAVLIIFIGVIPRFAPLLRSSRAEVPEFSQWVIGSALFLKTHLLVVGLTGMGLVMLVVVLFSRATFRQSLLDALAHAPAVGPWLRDAEVGRWATLMGTMLTSRVPLLQALQLSRGTLRLTEFSVLVASAARELEQGHTLHESLRHSYWIPASRLNLIRVGERAGTLDAMLSSLGEIQSHSASQKQKQALTLIEPVAILVIGAVIGVLMVSVMMAITSMNAGAV